ncbi:hypothetical protein, variant [Aphanomyces invadans]|nr:hypothetical protein, variant [Aphanomyces invadans]ETW08406.1 hypothetical protein, variant [Aphanomyces invadans]|eukprot:XP_008862211.1 hypothetical protein, variant [Aphanomyces invadans]
MYMSSESIVGRANEAALATPLYRLLIRHANLQARILVLKILLVLATADAVVVSKGCEVGAQGQAIVPNMFLSTLAKRHPDCEALQDLTKRLLVLFDMRKTTAYLLELSYAPPSPCPATPPKKSPAMLSSLRSPSFTPPTTLLRDKSPFLPQPKVLFGLRPKTTPAARPSPKHGSSPPRSKDKPNKGTSSPPHNRKLPVTLAPLDQIEQRLQSFDLTPPHTNTLQVIPKKTCKLAVPLIHSSVHDTVAPLAPLKSPPRQKATSHHASRDLTSASGFEWWWRTLPANHASLAHHAKLKAVCVAALRMHGAGIFDRAVELYTFALTMMPVPATLQVLPTPEDGDAETVHLPLKLHLNLGSAALSLGQITESVKAFETAIHMDPQSLWAHFKLGMAYNAAGRVEGAVKEWTAVAKLFPPAQAALDALGRGSSLLHPGSCGGGDSPTVKAKSTSIKSNPSRSGGASPSSETKSFKHRVRDVVRHLANMGARMEIDWPLVFSLVDRYHLGMVTTTTFREILHVSGLALTTQEYADLARYLRDPNDPNYVSHTKLLTDATFVAASASHHRTIPLDQVCFHGPRKRTTMENLRVPLHLIAQNECYNFFSTLASWAAFGVSKAIPGVPILHTTWMVRLTHVPAVPASVVPAEAVIIVRNAIAAGALQAKHIILVRLRAAKKLAVSLVAQAQFTACAHMSRWRKDGIHNVSVAMGGHILQCAVARLVLKSRVHTARALMERRSLARADLTQPSQRAAALLDLQRLATICLDEMTCRARLSIVGKRKSRAALARTATTSVRWRQRNIDAKISLVRLVTKCRSRIEVVESARCHLAEQVVWARSTLDHLRLVAWDQLVATTRFIVAQTTVSTILVTMVQTVAAARMAHALPEFDVSDQRVVWDNSVQVALDYVPKQDSIVRIDTFGKEDDQQHDGVTAETKCDSSDDDGGIASDGEDEHEADNAIASFPPNMSGLETTEDTHRTVASEHEAFTPSRRGNSEGPS